MSALPWRMLVVTDLGLEGAAPARVEPATLDAWFAAQDRSVGLPGGGRHALDSLHAFSPGAIRGALGAGATAAAVDAVLHDRELQTIEAAWRGLRLLLSHAGAPVEVEVVSLPRRQLAARFRERVHALEMAGDRPLSLVLLDAEFTHRTDDLVQLGELAAMAAELQAPMVAHAGAGFFELRYLVQAAAIPDLAARLAGPAYAGWQAFQRSDEARWLTLTLNRFLLRDPWQVEGHAEQCSESQPDSYLWGRGSWLVGAAAARSIVTHGHPLDLSGAGGRFEGLPTRPFPVRADEPQDLATEIPFAEMQMLTLAHAAFAPLVGPLRQGRVVLPLVTTTHRRASGKLTLEDTLAYQLTAARLAQECGAVLGTLAGGDLASLAGTVRSRLGAALGPLLGDGAGDALTVTPAEATDELPARLDVVVRPAFVLEGKPLAFELSLPVG